MATSPQDSPQGPTPPILAYSTTSGNVVVSDTFAQQYLALRRYSAKCCFSVSIMMALQIVLLTLVFVYVQSSAVLVVTAWVMAIFALTLAAFLVFGILLLKDRRKALPFAQITTLIFLVLFLIDTILAVASIVQTGNFCAGSFVIMSRVFILAPLVVTRNAISEHIAFLKSRAMSNS